MNPISFERERIQNLALYFVQNTKYVSTTKLCKLFYFLDIDVYVQTGFSVTNLQYRAKPRGPVPMEIWADIQDKRRNKYTYFDLFEIIKRETRRSSKTENDEIYLIAKKKKTFNNTYFSEIELQILQAICKKFYESLGTEMSEESHLHGSPWKEAWKEGKGDGDLIDFDLEARLHYNTEEIERRKFVQNMSTQQNRLIALL